MDTHGRQYKTFKTLQLNSPAALDIPKGLWTLRTEVPWNYCLSFLIYCFGRANTTPSLSAVDGGYTRAETCFLLLCQNKSVGQGSLAWLEMLNFDSFHILGDRGLMVNLPNLEAEKFRSTTTWLHQSTYTHVCFFWFYTWPTVGTMNVCSLACVYALT